MWHSNLAKGLRERGHEVRLISERYGWRQFPVDDICLERRTDINGKLAFVDYLRKALPILWHCKGYDIVQMSHPMFLSLRGCHMKPFYNFIRRNNGKLVMCSVGDDYHVLDQILNKNILRYSEQRIGSEIMHNDNVQFLRNIYLERKTANYCKYVAKDCDAIVAVLYEYWVCYNNVYPQKLHFFPLPVVMEENETQEFSVGDKVRFFIGLQRDRMNIKGTDIMLKAAQDIVRDYPDKAILQVVENVPYAEYEKMLASADVLLDQLYSYTPAMNALLAMSKGIIVVGGGEPENYEIINETELRPIINVEPTYESVYHELQQLVLHPERIPELKLQSIEYVKKHHDYLKVARHYVDFWTK
jgi:glycosyltransferase involved in cell wall biosynthesis